MAITERYYAHLAPDYVGEQVRTHLPSVGVEKSLDVARPTPTAKSPHASAEL